MAVVVAFAAAFLLGGCENALDLTDTRVEGDTLHISGTLNARSYDEIAKLLDAHPDLRTVVLHNIDGSIDDHVNLQTGLMLHEARLDTFVPGDAYIESGAVDLFCAGRERTVQRGAFVGVHTWQDEAGVSGIDLPSDHEDHAEYLDYFERVGCPTEFYWYSLRAAPAEATYAMNESELLGMGVATRVVD